MLRMISLLAAGLVASAPAAASGNPDPSGVWMRGDGNARVEIAPCGDKICATNLWIGEGSNGEAVGDKLVMTLAPQSDTALKGTAYDPKRDSTYAITITVAPDSLSTRGCVLAVLCKTVSWSRVK